MLCIQLVRFELDGVEAFKLEQQVEYQEDLDLSAYYTGGEELQYRLYAVVSHKGEYTSGHYVTVAKGQDGQWSKFDNLSYSVEKLGRENTVRYRNNFTEQGHKVPFTPYLLFYGKLFRSPITRVSKPSR